MRLAVTIVVDSVYPRNRNPLRWLINLLSHTSPTLRSVRIVARGRPNQRKIGIVFASLFPESDSSAGTLSLVHQRTDTLAHHHALNIAMLVEIEDHDRKVVFAAQRDGRGIHHSQP
jgi:hypothetical protein